MDPTNAVKYGWVEVGVVGTPHVLNTEATIEVVGLLVGDPQDWSVLHVGLEKRICSFLDDCVIPLFECFFTRIISRLPFSDLEVAILKYLKVASSKLHPRHWAFMQVFQMCA